MKHRLAPVDAGCGAPFANMRGGRDENTLAAAAVNALSGPLVR